MDIQIQVDENVKTAQIIYSKELDAYLQIVILPLGQIENEKVQLQAKLDILNTQQAVKLESDLLIKKE